MVGNALTGEKAGGQEAYSYIDLPIRSILCEAISLEIQDVDDESLKRIIAFMTLLTESGTYMFFTAESILAVTEAVSNQLSLRRFILGLYERTNILGASSGLDLEWIDQYQKAILKTRGIYGKDSLSSLIPNEVLGTLYSPNLERMLENNAWFITLYLAVFTGAWKATLVDYVAASN